MTRVLVRCNHRDFFIENDMKLRSDTASLRIDDKGNVGAVLKGVI
jgi:hypothetical protein